MKSLNKVIQDMHAFHGLSEEESTELLSKIKISSVEKNIVLFQEGDMGRELYMILEGKVEVFKKDLTGQEHTIMELEKGQAFGEMSLIDIQPRAAAIRTIEKCTLAVLSYNAVLDLYQQDIQLFTKIVLNLARDLSRRLRRMDAIYVDYSQVSPEHLSHFRDRFSPK